MAVIINPIFPEHNYFQSTGRRFYNLFQPIQATENKSNDFLAYALTPFVDTVLEPAFGLDASIHFLNAMVSLYKVLYLWTMNQQALEGVDYNPSVEDEWKESNEHFISFLSAIVAQILNNTLGILAWFTRPVASGIHALTPDTDHRAANPPLPASAQFIN